MTTPTAGSTRVPVPMPRAPRLPTARSGDSALLTLEDLIPTQAGPRAVLPCATTSDDLWFAASPEDVETATLLCLDCPLRQACLQGALSRGEPWGVWGGELLEEGVVVPRKRRRGRPPRSVTAGSAVSG